MSGSLLQQLRPSTVTHTYIYLQCNRSNTELNLPKPTMCKCFQSLHNFLKIFLNIFHW